MNRVHRATQKARKKGMSELDILKMREIARREAKKMEKEATEKAFLYMLAIPLNILCSEGYWEKTGKKRAPKFIEDVISLYESVKEGVVTNKELNDFLFEYSGVKIEADWLKKEEIQHE